MAFTISDKRIDEDIMKILKVFREDFGIKNASKTDVIRYLLEQKKQGKKTDFKWKNMPDLPQF